jgi:hypothetical protein
MPPKQLFIEGDMAHMPGAPARRARRSPDRVRKAGRARHLARYFCAAPSIPMTRKLAYLLLTSASSCCSLALYALTASMSENCRRTARRTAQTDRLLKPPATYLPPASLLGQRPSRRSVRRQYGLMRANFRRFDRPWRPNAARFAKRSALASALGVPASLARFSFAPRPVRRLIAKAPLTVTTPSSANCG